MFYSNYLFIGSRVFSSDHSSFKGPLTHRKLKPLNCGSTETKPRNNLSLSMFEILIYLYKQLVRGLSLCFISSSLCCGNILFIYNMLNEANSDCSVYAAITDPLAVFARVSTVNFDHLQGVSCAAHIGFTCTQHIPNVKLRKTIRRTILVSQDFHDKFYKLASNISIAFVSQSLLSFQAQRVFAILKANWSPDIITPDDVNTLAQAKTTNLTSAFAELLKKLYSHPISFWIEPPS